MAHNIRCAPLVGVRARQVEARHCKLPFLEALPTVLLQCRRAVVHSLLPSHDAVSVSLCLQAFHLWQTQHAASVALHVSVIAP